MIRNLTIAQRLVALLAVGSAFILALVVGFAATQHRAENAAGDLGAEILDREIQAKLEVATHSMALTLAQMRKDAPDEEAFLAQARAALQDLRFEEDKSGYFYVYRGTAPVVHPTKPKLVGKDLGDKKDARGNYFVRERAKMIAADGRAVLRYSFSKPGGGESLKLAYAERIPGTDLLVGTGAYLDNVEADRARVRAAIADIGVEGFLWVLLPLVLVGAAVLLPLGVLLARSITRPLKQTVQAMEDIATGHGDLTQRLDESGEDEIAQLGRAFNGFLGNLTQIIRSIASSSEELAGSATTLTDSSTRMADAARNMRARSESTSKAMKDVNGRVQSIATNTDTSSVQISNVAGTTQQLSGNAIEVAAGSKQVSSEIGTIAAAMEELAASFQEVAQSCQTSAQVGEQSSTRVHEAVQHLDKLQEAAGQVERIVDLINDVADQTNLLALNATIEAASAGDAGRGFAVVANEVKTLAQETAKATQDIAQYVAHMMGATKTSSEMMCDVAAHTDELRQLTNTIAAASEEQTMTIRELTQNVNLGATAVDDVMRRLSEISGGVEGLADSNQVLAEGTTEMASAARSMASRTTEVANDVDVLMTETDRAAREIEGVDQIARRLGDNAAGLQRLVAGFKM